MSSTEFSSTEIKGYLAEQATTDAKSQLLGLETALWTAVGYNQDPIAAAQEAFPTPARRRSDTQFECEPDEDVRLRASAAELGPGRPKAETLRHLGVEKVDTEIIEPGQLHKAVTELWLAL